MRQGISIFVTRPCRAGSNFSTRWNRYLIFLDQRGGAGKNEAEAG